MKAEENDKPQAAKAERSTERPAERSADQPTGEMDENALEQVGGGYQTGGSGFVGKHIMKWFPTDQITFPKINPGFDKI